MILPRLKGILKNQNLIAWPRWCMPEVGDCIKCGGFVIGRFDRVNGELRQPWCGNCILKHPSEYAPIFAAFVMEHSGKILAEMGVPPAYQTCCFKNFETKTKEQSQALRVAQDWAKSSTPGMFLCGRVGTGKTHLAVSALLVMRARRFSGRFVSALELL